MKRLTLISLACICIYTLQAQSSTDIRPIGLDLSSKEVSVQTLAKPNMEIIPLARICNPCQLNNL
jgi:hypothetical protein